MVISQTKKNSMLAVGKRLRKRSDRTEANINLSLNWAINRLETISFLVFIQAKILTLTLNQLLYVNRYQRKLDFFKQRSHKELYYDAVLKPSFLYGSSVWSSTSKTNLDSILRLQKRPARVILNAPFNSRSTGTCLIHLIGFFLKRVAHKSMRSHSQET